MMKRLQPSVVQLSASSLFCSEDNFNDSVADFKEELKD